MSLLLLDLALPARAVLAPALHLGHEQQPGLVGTALILGYFLVSLLLLGLALRVRKAGEYQIDGAVPPAERRNPKGL